MIAMLALTAIMAQEPPSILTAGKLAEECRIAERVAISGLAAATYEKMAASYCWGYMKGFVDATVLDQDPVFCLPGGVTIRQIAKIFLKYIDQWPEKWHESSIVTLGAALGATFLCHDSSPQEQREHPKR